MVRRQQQVGTDLLRQHAIALSALGRGDEAIAIWRRIAARLPDDADVAFHLAAALDAGGHHRDAEKTIRHAMTLGAVSPEAKYLHARTLIAIDRHDEAEALLREVVRALKTVPYVMKAGRDVR